jgi:hypothetical protein
MVARFGGGDSKIALSREARRPENPDKPRLMCSNLSMIIAISSISAIIAGRRMMG